MITPHVLTRIENFNGIHTPTTSDKGVTLSKQVKLALFNPVQYARMLNTPEVYKERFVVANITNALQSNSVLKNMQSTLFISNSYQHWTEPKYDLECSAKVDYMNNTGIIDIRLTSCTTPQEFALQCFSYKYHRHAAFVSDGLIKGNYIVLGVNKKKYNTFTLNISQTPWIAEGRAEYEELIDKLLLMNELDRDRILENI
jgi:hypothetical protein